MRFFGLLDPKSRPAARHWTLRTSREKLIKIGAKVVRHSRQTVFQMAAVAVPRELFRSCEIRRLGDGNTRHPVLNLLDKSE